MIRLGRSWLVLLVLIVSACATTPRPDQVVVPSPLLNSSGQFMSPYTQDGVLAEWVDKAIHVKLAGQVGSMAGSRAAQEGLKYIPFVGGLLGDMAGNAVGREIALRAIGGEAFLKSTSDISFNSLDDLAVYIYAKNSAHPAYNDALSSTMEIYPALKDRYLEAIYKAARR